MPTLSPQTSSEARATGQKNRLFCPSCGHESPTDGDWRHRATESGVVYTCPVCDAAVTTRPSDRRSRPTVERASADTVAGRATRLAVAWMAWPRAPWAGSLCAERQH